MAEAPWRPGPPPGADRRGEPPPCVQNAMMTKDKKPFTYTPGGIDLSEIKSPRMVRRMERNLNSPGVIDMPKSPLAGPSPPLPPAALAAMQPGPVQVFPVGAPPPPPPPAYMPPPPPPMQKLPTKPVATSEGVFERPDMTRIIPENPMALLRKTPKVEKKSFLDELREVPTAQRSPPANNQQPQYSPQPQKYAPQSPQYSPQPQAYSPQPQVYSPQPQVYSPQPQVYSPQPQVYSPQPQVYSPQPQQQYSPQPQYNSQPQPYNPQMQNNQYKPVASQNNVPQMVSPPEPLMQQPQVKTSNVNIGSLYIPPINQREKNETPPTPPQRQAEAQSPQSPIPKLNAAPKPWQNQKKEQDVPQWVQRNQQPPSPQEKPPPQATVSVRPPPMVTPAPMQPRQMVTPVQMQPPPSRPGAEVVYVTQPEVYQHPGGPGPNNAWVPPPHVQNRPVPPSPAPVQQRQLSQDPKGIRIIPIQVESTGQPAPKTPGNDEQFSRQQSWTPNQSNSFKVLQKMTSTEGNDEYGDSPMVAHGPRSSQQYPQNAADQMRKMNLNEGDKEFMNRVKQGVDDGTFLHNEVDPRYRGPAIPSKAFRLLQTMTDQPTSPGNQVAQIRTIPIQVEGNGSSQPYVHPSQQTVPEPKKYTGSAIPSKAFKMVQAMTSNALGPDQSDL